MVFNLCELGHERAGSDQHLASTCYQHENLKRKLDINPPWAGKSAPGGQDFGILACEDG